MTTLPADGSYPTTHANLSIYHLSVGLQCGSANNLPGPGHEHERSFSIQTPLRTAVPAERIPSKPLTACSQKSPRHPACHRLWHPTRARFPCSREYLPLSSPTIFGHPDGSPQCLHNCSVYPKQTLCPIPVTVQPSCSHYI